METDDAYWKCEDSTDRHRCVHFCKQGDVKTGASAVCDKTGKMRKLNKWFKRKESSATCLPCSSNPLEKFPIGGDGIWTCKQQKTNKMNRKCTIKCPAGNKLSGMVQCNRKKGMEGMPDNWVTSKPNPVWNC